MKSSFAVVTHLSIMNEDSKSHWLIDIFYNPEVVVVSLPHPFCLLNYKSIYRNSVMHNIGVLTLMVVHCGAWSDEWIELPASD